MLDEAYFDHQTYVQEEEELDFQNLKSCPHCKKPISQNAISCLYCGNSVTFSSKPTWMIWVAIFVLIVFVALALF